MSIVKIQPELDRHSQRFLRYLTFSTSQVVTPDQLLRSSAINHLW